MCTIFSGNLNVNCDSGGNGQYACQEADFYCPDEGVCNIKCATSGACDDTNIYVSTTDHEAIDLDCNPDVNDACSNTNIQCADTGSSTVMSYDSTNSYWKCPDFNCCPLNEGNITCTEGGDCLV